MSEGTPSRAQQRHTVELPVELTYEGQRIVVTSLNMSLGGMLVRPVEGIPFGAELSLSFQIPGREQAMVVEGYVCWVAPDVGLGIQYGALRANDVWAMQHFFNSLYQ